MPNSKARMETMLFNYATTYKTDYQLNEIKEPIFTTYKKKETCLMKRPLPLPDIHTLSNWKRPGIPFDLLLTKKDIIQTNPSTELKQASRMEKPIDEDREAVQKIRPRLVMTPAVSMDDVEDPSARRILCDYMYTTSMSHAYQQSAPVSPNFSVTAPLPGLAAPSNPLFLPKLQLPVVAPEWRMESVSWDRKQLRAHCDPTERFWLNHQLNRCKPCEQTATVNAHRKMQLQQKAGIKRHMS